MSLRQNRIRGIGFDLIPGADWKTTAFTVPRYYGSHLLRADGFHFPAINHGKFLEIAVY